MDSGRKMEHKETKSLSVCVSVPILQILFMTFCQSVSLSVPKGERNIAEGGDFASVSNA